MITALKKHYGVCFQCPEFQLMHSNAGYEISWHEKEWEAIPDDDAVSLVNRYLGVI